MAVREAEASGIVTLIEGSKLTCGGSNMMLVTAKCVFTHACGKRLIDANPCTGIVLSALLGPRPPIRKRLMLTREEIQLLLGRERRITLSQRDFEVFAATLEEATRPNAALESALTQARRKVRRD